MVIARIPLVIARVGYSYGGVDEASVTQSHEFSG
jgi:hypothetical protein